MPDLVDRLTEAAVAAIANERQSLESDAGGVRGLTVELVLNSAGQLTEAVAFIERRSKGAALLSRYAKDASA